VLSDAGLKGVFASAHGDSGGEHENPRREPVFGSPDRADRRGRPGPLVLGDGELLAFPVAARDGAVAWVFPALAIGRFLRLAPPAGDLTPLLTLLATIEEEKGPRALASPRLPELAAIPNLRSFAGATPRRAGPALFGLLAPWVGAAVPPGAPRLVVGSALTRRLWQSAAERRVLTGLSPGKTVQTGALRAIELIPAGSVFLSWMTRLAGAEPEIPALFQLGAWEGLGLGWVVASRIEGVAESSDGAAATPESTPPATLPEDARILVEMYAAVSALREAAPELAGAVRSAISDFASRVLRAGLEAALAFELAKAKPAHVKPGTGERAHRWLLAALLSSSPEPPAKAGVSESLLQWLGTTPFQPQRVAAVRDLILSRWLWLRRHAELGLDLGARTLEPGSTADG
jgi:hypothetical protein